ncbi:uncharacterized protein EAF01_004810 [Botrytis porri]|uniref:uncharacterized protein n=1 Tax=Botrytis porri TaxID=87229 RepID=UPI001900A174|nr:uncharacterized protein EAF01_004810 [Botrytis porri]KAF7907223.1 hypothetical protein EAF01_004810 [Botrytis porri]
MSQESSFYPCATGNAPTRMRLGELHYNVLRVVFLPGSAGRTDIFRSEYRFSELNVGGSAKSLIEPQGALVQMTKL